MSSLMPVHNRTLGNSPAADGRVSIVCGGKASDGRRLTAAGQI
jgi:hypothetical protein